jgi:hypothetical protein
MTSFKNISTLDNQLILDDQLLHASYVEYENMVHGRWNLPSGLSDVPGIHKVVTTDPYDAMSTLRRVLSKNQPKISIHPIAPNSETKEKTDAMERGMAWIYKQSSSRRPTDLTADLAWSAGLYGQCIGQVIDIKNEIGARKSFKGETKELQRALIGGPFLVELHNPKFVHIERSSYGIESVLTKKVIKASEAVSFWGERAKPLNAALAKMKPAERDKAYVTVFDHWAKDERWVYMFVRDNPNTNATPIDGEAIKIIEGENPDMEFMPWFARMTGSGLEGSTLETIQPMLKPVFDSGMWHTQCTIETMVMSKSIKLFGRPTLKEEGNNPAKAEVDYGPESMGDILKAPVDNTVSELRQDVLDQALLVMGDRVASRMDKATLSRLLQTGEFPSGMAASAINIVTQSAVEGLGPFKRVAEQAIEDIVRLELLHIHYAGEQYVVDGAAQTGQQQIVIDPVDINPSYIYVDVELTAVVPTDQVARANAGNMLMQMGYPVEKVFEQIGEVDGSAAMKQAMKEQFITKMFGEKLADIDLRVQMKAAQAQLQMQQQAQAAAQSAQNSQAGQTPPTGMEGQGANPAAGGSSAGTTFESQTGGTRDGTPLAQ